MPQIIGMVGPFFKRQLFALTDCAGRIRLSLNRDKVVKTGIAGLLGFECVAGRSRDVVEF